MKIAQIAHNYLPHIGGVEFYVKRIVDSLNKKGESTEVLSTNMATSEAGRKTEAKYFKVSFEFMRNPFSWEFIKHLRGNNYDILHLHSVWFLHSLIAVYFRKNARVIATIHGVYPDNFSMKLKLFLSLYKPFVSYILRQAERVFVYSAIEEAKLIKIFRVPANKISIIPMAINIEQYEDHSKQPVILFTGRIIPDKNPDVLIKAVALLDTKFDNYKVVFVGPIKDDYKQELSDLAKSLGIRHEIIFAGQLDPSVEHEKNTLNNHYKNAAAFVSLGSWEGQPTRLMEAMQFKTPVIAFAAGGTADFVTDGVNGIVIDELNPALLASKLEMLLADERLCTKLGAEARRTIERDYDWDKIFEKIYRVYQDRISRTSGLKAIGET